VLTVGCRCGRGGASVGAARDGRRPGSSARVQAHQDRADRSRYGPPLVRLGFRLMPEQAATPWTRRRRPAGRRRSRPAMQQRPPHRRQMTTASVSTRPWCGLCRRLGAGAGADVWAPGGDHHELSVSALRHVGCRA
jgi:hypothetical protein